VGADAASPDLWGFCGEAKTQVMAGLLVLRGAAPDARSRQHRRSSRDPVRMEAVSPVAEAGRRLDADPRELDEDKAFTPAAGAASPNR
jgi:hypothetical protein